MGYLQKLSDEERIRLCGSIPEQTLKNYVDNHGKEFTKFIGLGYFNLLKENPIGFLKKFVKDKVVTSFLEQTITKQINIIDKKIKEETLKSNSQTNSYIVALIDSIFEDNVDLFFKLKDIDNKIMEGIVGQQIVHFKETGEKPVFEENSHTEKVSDDSKNIIQDQSLKAISSSLKNENDNQNNDNNYGDVNGVSVTKQIEREKSINSLQEANKETEFSNNELNLDNFEDLLNYYENQSKILQVYLKEDLEQINLGFALDYERISLVNSISNQLRATYDKISLLAKKYSELDNMPKNVSIPEFTRIIKQAILKRKVKDIENKLNAFVSIQSLFEDYENSFTPYRNQAYEIIKKLDSIDSDIPEDITKIAENADDFLSLLLLDNLDSPEGEKLLDNICDIYTSKVQRGIFFNKYRMAEELRDSYISKKN